MSDQGLGQGDLSVPSQGYDVSGRGSPRSRGMLNQQLSSRREVVEQLDSEPLFDYLQQNGVLEDQTIDEIRQEMSPAKANLALLKKVEDHGKSAEGLLIIGLRQTGQHYLANLLDESDRIKALSGSGYLSKSRHKGQLNLKVQLRAVKLASESFKSSTGEILARREWVSLDDVLLRGLSNGHKKTEPPREEPPPAIQQFEISETTPDVEEKKSCCFCGCFAKLFSKSKEKNLDKNNSVNGSAKPRSSKYIETGSAGQSSVSLNEPVVRPQIKRAASERIRNLDNVFRQKCADFYTLLSDASSDPHTLLLKYFEQERGLLVLNTIYDSDGVVVMNICNTAQQFMGLRQDYTNGKLLADLEKWIVTEETLQSLGARGLKLNLECQVDDLEQVEQELS